MNQLEEYCVGDKVYLLKKSLYCLKQISRQWYFGFDEFILKNDFIKCNYDNYVLCKEGKM